MTIDVSSKEPCVSEMKCLLIVATITLLALSGFPPKELHGQVPDSTSEFGSLFETEEVLALTLKTDLRSLFRNRGEEEEEQEATVSYSTPDGSIVSLPLKVRLRGNFRRMRQNCSFPPIRLNFPKKTVEGTLFDSQDKLKLVTHCQDNRSAYEQYVLLEYLIYRAYNQLTDMSFRVRLVEMTYEDTSGKRRPSTRYGFLIEDEDVMAQRNGGEILDREGRHQEATDRNLITTMSLFQYMIGNTDWSVYGLHNIKLVQTRESPMPYAVPYDFDFSGLVDAPYAAPPPMLPIEDVRDRLYRGYCRSEEELAPHFDLFRDKKEAIYALFRDLAPLNDKYRKNTIRYLDGFYRTIDSSRSIRRVFVRSCRKLD